MTRLTCRGSQWDVEPWGAAMPPRSGAALGAARLGRKRQCETMQVYKPALVQLRADIAARQNKRDRQLPAAAPIENHTLSGGQHLPGDPRHPALRAIFVRVHAGVVQAQAEARPPPIRLVQSAPDSGEVVR